MEEYEEYLEHLVIEVEGKVGTMPACLRTPLKTEPITDWISPVNSPCATPYKSTVADEGQFEDSKRQVEEVRKDINDNEDGKMDSCEDDVSSDDGKMSYKDRLEKNFKILKDSMVNISCALYRNGYIC